MKAILRRTENALPSAAAPPAGEPTAIFSIDEGRCEIRFHSVPLVLSRYEFRLLKILVEKPGRVFSREQLMDQPRQRIIW